MEPFFDLVLVFTVVLAMMAFVVASTISESFVDLPGRLFAPFVFAAVRLVHLAC